MKVENERFLAYIYKEFMISWLNRNSRVQVLFSLAHILRQVLPSNYFTLNSKENLLLRPDYTTAYFLELILKVFIAKESELGEKAYSNTSSLSLRQRLLANIPSALIPIELKSNF